MNALANAATSLTTCTSVIFVRVPMMTSIPLLASSEPAPIVNKLSEQEREQDVDPDVDPNVDHDVEVQPHDDDSVYLEEVPGMFDNEEEEYDGSDGWIEDSDMEDAPSRPCDTNSDDENATFVSVDVDQNMLVDEGNPNDKETIAESSENNHPTASTQPQPGDATPENTPESIVSECDPRDNVQFAKSSENNHPTTSTQVHMDDATMEKAPESIVSEFDPNDKTTLAESSDNNRPIASKPAGKADATAENALESNAGGLNRCVESNDRNANNVTVSAPSSPELTLKIASVFSLSDANAKGTIRNENARNEDAVVGISDVLSSPVFSKGITKYQKIVEEEEAKKANSLASTHIASSTAAVTSPHKYTTSARTRGISLLSPNVKSSAADLPSPSQQAVKQTHVPSPSHQKVGQTDNKTVASTNESSTENTQINNDALGTVRAENITSDTSTAPGVDSCINKLTKLLCGTNPRNVVLKGPPHVVKQIAMGMNSKCSQLGISVKSQNITSRKPSSKSVEGSDCTAMPLSSEKGDVESESGKSGADNGAVGKDEQAVKNANSSTKSMCYVFKPTLKSIVTTTLQSTSNIESKIAEPEQSKADKEDSEKEASTCDTVSVASTSAPSQQKGPMSSFYLITAKDGTKRLLQVNGGQLTLPNTSSVSPATVTKNKKVHLPTLLPRLPSVAAISNPIAGTTAAGAAPAVIPSSQVLVKTPAAVPSTTKSVQKTDVAQTPKTLCSLLLGKDGKYYIVPRVVDNKTSTVTVLANGVTVRKETKVRQEPRVISTGRDNVQMYFIKAKKPANERTSLLSGMNSVTVINPPTQSNGGTECRPNIGTASDTTDREKSQHKTRETVSPVQTDATVISGNVIQSTDILACSSQGVSNVEPLANNSATDSNIRSDGDIRDDVRRSGRDRRSKRQYSPPPMFPAKKKPSPPVPASPPSRVSSGSDDARSPQKNVKAKVKLSKTPEIKTSVEKTGGKANVKLPKGQRIKFQLTKQKSLDDMATDNSSEANVKSLEGQRVKSQLTNQKDLDDNMATDDSSETDQSTDMSTSSDEEEEEEAVIGKTSESESQTSLAELPKVAESEFIPREEKMRMLQREIMEQEKALEKIKKQRQKELEMRKKDPELFDL